MSEKADVYLKSSPLSDLIISKSDEKALYLKLGFAKIRGELYAALIQRNANIGGTPSIASLQKQVSFMMVDIITDSTNDVISAYYEKNEED